MLDHFSCFVTGTDTDVGKSLITSALLHALVQQGVSAVGMKPVAAGCTLENGQLINADVEQLFAAGNLAAPFAQRCQYLFEPFCAPHIAAAQAGVEISLAPILAAYQELASQAQVVVVEGVGGFRVPFSSECDSADLAQQLALPVILVVGLRLGCINHALLTKEAIAARGLRLIGWVANLIDPNMPYQTENIAALQAGLQAPLLGYVPRLPEADAAHAAAYLNFSVLPHWPMSSLAAVSPSTKETLCLTP